MKELHFTIEQRRKFQDLIRDAIEKKKAQGKTQEEMANEMGLSPHLVGDAKRGIRENMQLIPSLILFNYLGIPTTEVLDILGIRTVDPQEVLDEEAYILCDKIKEAPPDVRSAIKLILR